MTIKLVPEQPETPLQTEEQARAYLYNLHTPALDDLRSRLRTMKTSELVGLMANVEFIANAVCTSSEQRVNDESIMAAILAVSDEIDRRVPIPG